MSIDTTPVSGAPEERGLSLQSDGTRASGRSRTATAAQVWRCAKAVPPLTSTPKLNIGPVVDFLPCIAVDHELAVCDRGTPELGPRRLLDGLRRPLETEMDWWLTRLDSEAFACAGRDETFLARTSVELTVYSINSKLGTTADTVDSYRASWPDLRPRRARSCRRGIVRGWSAIHLARRGKGWRLQPTHV